MLSTKRFDHMRDCPESAGCKFALLKAKYSKFILKLDDPERKALIKSSLKKSDSKEGPICRIVRLCKSAILRLVPDIQSEHYSVNSIHWIILNRPFGCVLLKSTQTGKSFQKNGVYKQVSSFKMSSNVKTIQ